MQCPTLTLKGQITAIEPSLDSTTRALVLRVLIPKTDARVRDGMTARARLLLASNNALFVPEQALVAQKAAVCGVCG
jgi:multidrug efflux pump subunit AcrA (membrane-fusion protein)